MDYKLANQYAEQIKLGGSGKTLKKLVLMCIPRLRYWRRRLGFYRIPAEEIEQSLASEAVSDAIMAQERRNLPFTICLHNAFRDCCRERLRSIREQDVHGIIDKCDIRSRPNVIGIGPRRPSAEDQVEDDEIIELAYNVLRNHDRFSRQVVYQKTRGSTYPEMAEIFGKTLDKCKRVYWNDVDHLRSKIK